MARESVLPELRAATFAAACLGLGAGAHLAMSGDAIPAWALVVGGIVSYLPARYAAGRGERGLLGIAGLMGGLQVALHLLFSYAQQAAGAAGGAGSMPGMAMPSGTGMPPGMSMPATTASAVAAAVTPHSDLHMSFSMLAAHALAALACAWWLRQGEAAVHAVIRGVSFWLGELWVVVVPTAIAPADRVLRPASTASRPRTLRSQWLRGTLGVRGPPCPSRALS